MSEGQGNTERRSPAGPFAGDAYALAAARLERLTPADGADAGDVAAILAATDPWARLGFAAADLHRYLCREDPGLERFVVRVAGAAAGVVCLRYPWLRGAYIEVVGLAPAARGTGLGSAIVAWMTGRLNGRAGNLWATVSAFNAPGRRFYRRQGFAEIAVLDDLVRAGEDDVLLRKRLD